MSKQTLVRISALVWLLLAWLLLGGGVAAQPVSEGAPGAAPPAPPRGVEVRDHPWDGGDRIDVKFAPSPDDRKPTPEEEEAKAPRPVLYYEVLRSPEANGLYTSMALHVTTAKQYRKGQIEVEVDKCQRGAPYWFKVRAVGAGGVESPEVGPIGPVVAARQGFDGGRFWLSIITVILCGSVIYWIDHARRGRPVKVRKIAALEAIDEAVGRTTEMGRSCLFVIGTQDMNDIQTIAGITVLARVAKTAAEYDAKVEVPTSRSLVMTAARETVQAAFLAAGRPDAYRQDLIYYVTDEQFGFVAYLQGMMVRQKPAACFYFGAFFAESLILAEAGNSIGAIQVAGTAEPSQLPFFVAACDYTLIGEELFAASAYLTGTPEQLGSLKGQDVGKLVVAAALLVGMVLATLASVAGPESPSGAALQDAVDYLRDVVFT